MKASDIAAKLDGWKEGREWRAACPMHAGHGLMLRDGKNGLLAHCFGGCPDADVYAELRRRGYLPERTPPSRSGQRGRKAQKETNVRPEPVPLLPVPGDAPQCAWRHPKHGAPSAMWAYRNAAGELVAYAARVDFVRNGKPEKAIYPITFCDLGNGERGWRAKGLPEPRPLHRLPELTAAPRELPVIVVEGEKKCAPAEGFFPQFIATTSMGGAKAAAESDWGPLAKRRVVIWPDHDKPGAVYAGDVARFALAAGAAEVRVVSVPPTFPEGWDLADPPPNGVTIDDLGRLLEGAELVKPPTLAPPETSAPLTDDQIRAELAGLAKLSVLEYERERKAAAARMGIVRISTLDKLVAAERAGDGASPGQGRPLALPELEPWPEPVDGAKLLTEISAAVRRKAVLKDGLYETVALWVLHTHALDAFNISPRLAITSAEKGCGKTTLLDVLGCLVPRPLSMTNVTTAAVYRTIELAMPTLLVDEADTFLTDDDELRGVLNSGHRRGGQVVRLVGDDHEPRQFSTWSPCAIAMIGGLPATLADRSVSIRMERRRRDEAIELFRIDRADNLRQLARKAVRWAADNRERLAEMDPAMPGNLSNRQADNWRPLLAIADGAGGGWPRRAREIAAATVDAAESTRASLLADIKAVFDERAAARNEYFDRIFSAELASALAALEGRPWAEWGRQVKPLTKNQLARLLAPYQISPGTVRAGVKTDKGYKLEQFADAFERYLPNRDFQNVTPSHTAENLGSPGAPETSHAKTCDVSKNAANQQKPAHCDVVTDQNPPGWENEL